MSFGSQKYQVNSVSSRNTYVYGILILDDLKEIFLGSGSNHQPIQVFDLKTFKWKRTIPTTGHTYVWSILRLSKKLIAIAGGGNEISVINLKTGKLEYKLSGHTSSFYQIIKISNKHIASTNLDRSMRVWDWKNKKMICNITLSKGGITLCYVRKHKILCTAGYIRGVECFKMKKNFTKGEKWKTLDCNSTNTWSLCEVGKKEVAVGTSNSIFVFDVIKGNMIHQFTDQSSVVYRMLGVPKSSIFVAGSGNKSITFYDWKKKKNVKKITTPQLVYSCKLSKSGRLVCGGNNSMMWHFKTDYKFGNVFSGHESDSDFDSDFDEESDEEEVGEDDEDGEENKAKKLLEQDYLTRFDFLINESEMADLEVKFKNKSFEFFKSFMSNSKFIEQLDIGAQGPKKVKGPKNYNDDSDSDSDSDSDLLNINVDEKISISSEDAMKIMFGMKVKIKDEELFDYYLLFRSLGLKSRAYLICKRAAKINKISVLLYSYMRAQVAFEQNVQQKKKKEEKKEKKGEDESDISKYLSLDEEEGEKSDDDGGGDDGFKIKQQYNSAFTLQIMNQFKDREDDIKRKRKLFKVFKEKKIILKLNEHIINPIKKHDEFKDIKTFPKHFKMAFTYDLKKLISSKKFYNLTLTSKDGKPFRTHREILILKMNFFHKMNTFSGIENEAFRNKGTLSLQYVDGMVLRELLYFVYAEDIKTDSIDVLFQLLSHAKMYFERDLLKKVIKKLKKISKRRIRELGIYGFLRQYMHIIRNVEVVEDLIPSWSDNSELSVNKIYEFVEKTKIADTIKDLKKKVVLLENSNSSIRNVIEKFQSRVDALKEKFAKK